MDSFNVMDTNNYSENTTTYKYDLNGRIQSIVVSYGNSPGSYGNVEFLNYKWTKNSPVLYKIAADGFCQQLIFSTLSK